MKFHIVSWIIWLYSKLVIMGNNNGCDWEGVVSMQISNLNVLYLPVLGCCLWEGGVVFKSGGVILRRW